MGKSHWHQFFSAIPFCSSLRWTCGYLTNSGRSSAPTNTPQKHKKVDKRHFSVFIGGMAIYFLIFFTQRKTVPLFSAAILSSAKQKKHRQEVSYVLPGFHFSFLANPLLKKQHRHRPHLPLQYFVMGKKLKPKNRKIWYYCDLKPNSRSLNHINIFLFVNPFIEDGQL